MFRSKKGHHQVIIYLWLKYIVVTFDGNVRILFLKTPRHILHIIVSVLVCKQTIGVLFTIL
jgi:hypothetical protein